MPKLPATIKTEVPENPVTLKYGNSRFTLENVTSTLCAQLLKDAYWKREGGTFQTSSLRAAAKLRDYADNATQKIFTRCFQSYYPKPKPPLTAFQKAGIPHLDAHQREGLEWVLTRKRSYLAHAPGAGKTITALMAGYLALEEAGPGHQALFIVPPTLIANWEREVNRVSRWLDIWPSCGVIAAGREDATIAWDADLVLCADSMLSNEMVYLALTSRRPIFLAVDEASRFKEPFTERSIRLYGGRSNGNTYNGLYRNARYVVMLDGSPMPNRPMELWAPVFALDPEAIDCMDRDDFGYRYCGARPNERGQWEFNGSSHEAELQERLTKSFMHVVPETELTHPERRRTLLYMPRDIRSSEMKAWERKYITELTFDEIKEGMDQGDIAHYRAELGMRKVPFIAKYVKERLTDKNESVLLFCWHRPVIEALAERLKELGPGVIYGGTNAGNREGWIKSFQAGKTKLLIMNILSGGRGHNLQRADRVIFGEYSWTDELNKQCEKRASRRGSENAFVRCEYIVCPRSMDEIVLKALFTKEKRVKKIIG